MLLKLGNLIRAHAVFAKFIYKILDISSQQKKKQQQQHKNISVHKNKYMSRMLESMEFISDWT